MSAALSLGRRVPGEVLVLAAIVLAAILVSSLASEFQANEWTLWVLYGLLALSFTFIWGHGGIFSFGQAAFFGLGGYAYSVAAINLLPHTNETITALLTGALVGAIAAGLVGYFIFYGDVNDVAVAIITLAFSLVLLTVMSGTADPKYHIGTAQLGGYNGMVGVPPITVGLPGGTPMALSQQSTLELFAIVAGAIAVGVHVLLRRPFGRVVAALRVNELRTLLLGFDVRRYKLATFMLGGAIAGLAGAGYAAWGIFISPAVFGLQQAAFVAIWVLLGGRTSLLGAFVGVVLVEELTSKLGGNAGDSTPIVLGAVLIAVVLLLPAGIVPTLQRWGRRLLPGPRERPSPARASERTGPENAQAAAPVLASEAAWGAGGEEVLRADELGKRFGGVRALDRVSVDFPGRGLSCLIGPNGAGKSTFFHLLSGRHRPSTGEVVLDGRRITSWRPDRRARAGLGIKLQVPSLYHELSASENMWLAAYARTRSASRADRRAAEMLDWLGLAERAADPASVLSHGQQQWLEIGMVVATEPKVILLDEPTAGMSPEETQKTARLVTALAEQAAVIVVEHDMDFVRELDAPVMMFHEGSLFAHGSISELREDERILDIYLGRPVGVEG
ncbi:MAG TPA: ATP-binding cassette domain-containing protein [Solirubrobacterales bacterium]|nr:ATP-binding cassette domain-containing protein [Solirubrobacterales bacterium]